VQDNLRGSPAQPDDQKSSSLNFTADILSKERFVMALSNNMVAMRSQSV
jgi:hypothetical protein